MNRAVGALEDAGLVEWTGDGYEPTLAAALALEQYEGFVATGADVLEATEIIAVLDHDAEVSTATLRGAERHPAGEYATYAKFGRVRDTLASADAAEILLPTTRALPPLDQWQDPLVAADDATVVLDESLHESVREEHRSLPWLAGQGVDVFSGDTPTFVLGHVGRATAGPRSRSCTPTRRVGSAQFSTSPGKRRTERPAWSTRVSTARTTSARSSRGTRPTGPPACVRIVPTSRSPRSWRPRGS